MDKNSMYIVVLPPNSGMIVEKVSSSAEVSERVQKYCGWDRRMVNAPLPSDCIVYVTTSDKSFLPVNLPLSWVVGGGECKNVTECFYGFGVVCCYDSEADPCITGFDGDTIHRVMRDIRMLVPGRCY